MPLGYGAAVFNEDTDIDTLTAGKIYPMQMEYFENQQEGANFTSNLYSDDLVIGKEYDVKVKHIDGYIYVIYHRTIELVPIDDSDTFEEKRSLGLFQN